MVDFHCEKTERNLFEQRVEKEEWGVNRRPPCEYEREAKTLFSALLPNAVCQVRKKRTIRYGLTLELRVWRIRENAVKYVQVRRKPR